MCPDADELKRSSKPGALASDGLCRLDKRFAASSLVVRRLGGDALAEHLVCAVKKSHEGSEGWVNGRMTAHGVNFRYDFNCADNWILISRAEVVAPDAALPSELVTFFAALWERRATLAHEVGRRFASLPNMPPSAQQRKVNPTAFGLGERETRSRLAGPSS